ncbi:hypothetical protein Sjap_010980 [Stephania japonica]|uniref:Uncharacterized protein n=1 Tax=Stephania japonica TaxID=461633 RepID=A0AAP0P4M7_9MAGN
MGFGMRAREADEEKLYIFVSLSSEFTPISLILSLFSRHTQEEQLVSKLATTRNNDGHLSGGENKSRWIGLRMHAGEADEEKLNIFVSLSSQFTLVSLILTFFSRHTQERLVFGAHNDEERLQTPKLRFVFGGLMGFNDFGGVGLETGDKLAGLVWKRTRVANTRFRVIPGMLLELYYVGMAQRQDSQRDPFEVPSLLM